MKKSFWLIPIIVLSGPLWAQERNASESAFCEYTREQAAAQAALLRSPAVVGGPVLPETGTGPQAVVGLSLRLAEEREAGLTMNVSRTACNLYVATTEAQKQIVYALPAIEKDVLLHRLTLLGRASSELTELVHDQEGFVQAHNLSRPAVYYLQTALVRLDTSRTATLTGIVSPYVPPLSDVPLRELVGNKLQAEQANQRALTRLNKENGWDIEVGGGVHQQLGNVPYPTVFRSGLFAQFSVNYNLGRLSAHRHLDRSVGDYIKWKESQFDDVAQQALVLKKQIEDTIRIQEGQAQLLQAHNDDIKKSLDLIRGLDTPNALSFRNQLLADQIVLRVEIDDAQFRLDRLRQYLAANF